MPGPSDFESLTERASRGDADAVQLLLERYLPALRAFVRLRVSPGLRAQEAESDIVQSTCRRVLEKAADFQTGGEEGFKRWLFTTAFRTLLDKSTYWRAAKRAGAQVEFDDEAAMMAYRSLSSPSQHAIGHEIRERLERAFDALSDEDREVIVASAHQDDRADPLMSPQRSTPGGESFGRHSVSTRLAPITRIDFQRDRGMYLASPTCWTCAAGLAFLTGA